MRSATASDLPEMLELLSFNHLPRDGVSDHLERFMLEFDDQQRLIGCAGLELYGSAALLRSVAIHPDQRSSGIGKRLVRAQLEAARDSHATSVSLLTTTADTYFPRFGFAPVPRSALPAALGDSLELRGACPDSAIAMHLSLS